MSALVSLNGSAASRAVLQLPSYGLWWADVDLVDPLAVAIGTRVSIDYAGLALSGTVMSGGAFEGRAAYRVVAGGGGWGKRLGRKGYRNDLGARAAQVATDAAQECGEIVDVTGLSARLGAHYARAEGAASDALNLLAPRAWYAGLDGIVRFTPRPVVSYTGDAPRVNVWLDAGVVELAVESASGLEPGVIVSPLTRPASDVEISLEGSRLTARVSSGVERSERLSLWARLFDALDPGRKYRGVYEYRVGAQVGERYDLQAVRTASGMPDLRGVPVRGAAGVRAQVLPGSLVLVAFVDADPSRPAVVAHDAADAPGWMPLAVKLGQDPTLGVARLADLVVAGPFGGAITTASARIQSGV